MLSMRCVERRCYARCVRPPRHDPFCLGAKPRQSGRYARGGLGGQHGVVSAVEEHLCETQAIHHHARRDCLVQGGRKVGRKDAHHGRTHCGFRRPEVSCHGCDGLAVTDLLSRVSRLLDVQVCRTDRQNDRQNDHLDDQVDLCPLCLTQTMEAVVAQLRAVTEDLMEVLANCLGGLMSFLMTLVLVAHPRLEVGENDLVLVSTAWTLISH